MTQRVGGTMSLAWERATDRAGNQRPHVLHLWVRGGWGGASEDKQSCSAQALGPGGDWTAPAGRAWGSLDDPTGQLGCGGRVWAVGAGGPAGGGGAAR